MHCLNPLFLAAQFEQSRTNLGLETIDLLYLHNPYEMHGPLVSEEIFKNRLYVQSE